MDTDESSLIAIREILDEYDAGELDASHAMQAIGMVNDHLVDCFRYGQILKAN